MVFGMEFIVNSGIPSVLQPSILPATFACDHWRDKPNFLSEDLGEGQEVKNTYVIVMDCLARVSVALTPLIYKVDGSQELPLRVLNWQTLLIDQIVRICKGVV